MLRRGGNADDDDEDDDVLVADDAFALLLLLLCSLIVALALATKARASVDEAYLIASFTKSTFCGDNFKWRANNANSDGAADNAVASARLLVADLIRLG